MTTPQERTRALRFAGEVLQELLKRDDVPADLKSQARATLRHYPDRFQLQAMIMAMEHGNDGLGPPWLAPEQASSNFMVNVERLPIQDREF